MATVVLVQALPRNPATGATVPVRLAGGGSRRYDQLGFTDWLAGITNVPRFTAGLGFEQSGWTGGALPQTGAVRFFPSDRAVLTQLGNLNWNKARITISVGDDEAPAPAYTTQLVGTVAAGRVDVGTLILTIADLSIDLDKPVCPDTFAGTGGAEGGDDATGRIKRRTWGRVFNVEGRLLDKAYGIYEFGDPGRPLNAFPMVKDKGREYGAYVEVYWQGTVAATLAALRAVAVPQNAVARAPSIAACKPWTTPAGPITADIQGEVGPGYIETCGSLAARIVSIYSTDIAVSNTTEANGWQPGAAGVHCDESTETVGNLLDRLLLPVRIAWLLGGDAVLSFRVFKWTDPVESLIADTIEREVTFQPLKTRRVGFQRNHRQHSDAEISAALILATDATYADGTPIEVLKPAEAGATLGARAGANLKDNGGSILTDNAIKNLAISLGSNGVLAGAGGGQVTYPGIGGKAVGLQDNLDLGGPYITSILPVAKASNGLINANVSIGPNGTLSGGGGGQVTIVGLGFVGDLGATTGQNMVANAGAEAGNTSQWTTSDISYQAGTPAPSLGAIYRGSATPLSGSYCFALQKAASGDSIAANSRARAVRPGATYTVRISVRDLSSGTAQGLFMRVFTKATEVDFVTSANFENNNFELQPGNRAVTAGWSTYEFSWTCPAGQYWASLCILNYQNGPANMLFDDVFMAEQVSWGNGLASVPANLSSLVGSETIRNLLVSIGPNGALAGGGGGQVTISGLGYGGDLDAERNSRISFYQDTAATGGRARLSVLNNGSALGGVVLTLPEVVQNLGITIGGTTLLGIGTGNGTAVANLGLTIGANGALSGGGGGQVTLPGIGFIGSREATSGLNLILNPGGEEGTTDNWQVGDNDGTVSFTVLPNSSAAPHSGAASFALNKATTNDIIGVFTRARPVTPGATYLVSFWVRAVSTPQSTGFYPRIFSRAAKADYVNSGNFENSNYELLGNGTGNRPTPDPWTQISALWTCPAGHYWASINVLNFRGGPTLMAIDDVFLGDPIVSRLDQGTGRVSDPSLYNTALLMGPTNTTNLVPSYSVGSSNVTISLPSHDRKIQGITAKQTLSFGGASGVQAFSTYWLAYIVLPNLISVASPIVVFSNDPDELLVRDRYQVASGVTPAAGGGGGNAGGGGGNGGGYENCVAAESFMPDGRRAMAVRAGDTIRTIDEETWTGSAAREVDSNELANAECVRLTSASGLTVVVSVSTPCTLRGGAVVPAPDALGAELAVEDDAGFRWEAIVAVEPVGYRAVAHIRCGGGTYAAGEEPGRFVYTHNPTYKP